MEKFKIPALIKVLAVCNALPPNQLYKSHIAKKSNITDSHVNKIIYYCVKNRIMKINRRGRTNFISFTGQGKELVQASEKLVKLIKEVEEG